MDEMSEKTVNISEEKAPLKKSENPKKQKEPKTKMSKKKKAIIIVLAILLSLLLLVGIAFLALNIYADYMLGLITYDDPEEEISWEGVDIDSPEYNDNYDIGVKDPDSFVDPDGVGDQGSSSGNAGYVPNINYEQYTPDYEIIEGVFDDNIIEDEDEKDVVNILLIGADTISGNSARSDTMILMSINHAKRRIVFTSFMRDTYVAIPGRNDNRLNAAFAAGGPNLLMRTLKYNFDITVDYYFIVSIASFEMAVDAIGGLDIVVNETNYNYFKYHQDIKWLSKDDALDGTRVLHLSGGQALAYARSRNFTDGDFTRTLHQRDLLTQTVQRCKTASLDELHQMLKSVLPYVRTNMPKNTLKSMVWNVLTYVQYDVTNARVPNAGGFEFANIRGMEVLLLKDFNAVIEYLKLKIYV